MNPDDVVITISKPSVHGQSEFRLRFGVINDDAIELFGFAKCHLLAAALHERTGWPFALVEQLIDNVWTWAHAGVITPDRRMLDIHGVRTLADVEAGMLREYGHIARVRVLPSQVELVRVVTGRNEEVQHWAAGISTLVGVDIVLSAVETLLAQVQAVAA